MGLHCRYCDKYFSTASNAKRHEKDCPSNEDEDTSAEEESENEEMKEEITDVEKSSEEVENSSEEEDESDEGKESRVWGFLCRNAWDGMEIPQGKSSDELLKDKEFVKETNDEIRKSISNWTEVVNFLQTESETYAKLQKTIDRLREDDEYSEKEATEKAFKERKILIKGVMKKNNHILEEVIQNETDEDGEEDEDGGLVPPPQGFGNMVEPEQ